MNPRPGSPRGHRQGPAAALRETRTRRASAAKPQHARLVLLVLLGQASHGTHEFYRESIRITRRLIAECGFTAVAIEGDSPDAHHVNRYVQGARGDGDAEEALRGFRRFPTWMWRNADVVDFIGWLRAPNDRREPAAPKVGFHGLDLYSLGASMEAVIAYLDRVDPGAATRARQRYACLQPHAGDEHGCGQAVLLGVSEPCRRQVFEQLLDLRRVLEPP